MSAYSPHIFLRTHNRLTSGIVYGVTQSEYFISHYTVCPTRYRTRHFFNNSNTNEELSIGYFQQDGATSHTSHASMAEIQSFSGDRDIIIKLLMKCRVQ